MKLSVISNCSLQESSEITKLLTDSFPGNLPQLEALFSLMILKHPGLRIIAVKNEKQEIVSVLFLLQGRLVMGETTRNFCNMSFFVTKQDYRRGPATKLIVTYVTEVVLAEFDLVFGFPRHVMQGYWSKYGFRESTNNRCYRVMLPQEKIPEEIMVSYRLASRDDATTLTRLYSSASAQRVMNFVRDESKWHYILEFCKVEGITINIISEISGRDIGYFCERDNTILEIVFSQHLGFKSSPLRYMRSLLKKEIALSLRGVIPLEGLDLRGLPFELQDALMKPEDKWDFMYNSVDATLQDYLELTEGDVPSFTTLIGSGSNFQLNSNFTILDQI